MKKIFALILCAVMLASVLVFDASAATLIHSDDFNTGFAPRNWYVDDSCAFMWDKENGCIHGYSDAVVLQTKYTSPYNKKWDKFYASYDFQIRADDDATEVGETPNTSVGLWYRDMFESDPVGAVYTFFINVQSGEATLAKSHTFSYKDESGIVKEHTITDAIIAGPVKIDEVIKVGEAAPWYSIGMRVDSGKIECYFNDKLIMSAESKADDEKLGDVALNNVDPTVGSQNSPVLFWNVGNWIAVDNFEVWSVDYNFDADINYGDADGNGAVNLLDASAMMKSIAGWTNVTISEAAADVNGDSKVSLVDVGLVMKACAKWDVVLGPQA